MCTHKGKQLGLGARRGLWGDSLRDPCESVLGARPLATRLSAECLYTDCFRGRDGLPGAAGAKGRPGDTHRRRGWSSGSTLWCVGTTAALLGVSAGAPTAPPGLQASLPAAHSPELAWVPALHRTCRSSPGGLCQGAVRAGTVQGRASGGVRPGPPEAEPLLREGRDICL